MTDPYADLADQLAPAAREPVAQSRTIPTTTSITTPYGVRNLEVRRLSTACQANFLGSACQTGDIPRVCGNPNESLAKA